MTELLERAIKELHALNTLPGEEQDRIAAHLLEEVRGVQKASSRSEEERKPIW